MRVGKINEIQLILNNWFLVLMCLFTVAGMAGKALAVFSAILLHELAHAAAALALGFAVREVELLPFGGVARIERLGEAGSSSEIIIAAAGPITSLVLAAFSHIGMLNFPDWSAELGFYKQINLMLAIFNLMPGLPLDGGRILRAWLSKYRDYTEATLIAANVSKVIAFSLSGIVIYDYVTTETVNLTFIFAAVFLYVAAKTEVKIAGFRQMRVLSQKKAILTAKGVMQTSHLTALEGTSVRDIINLFGPEEYYVVLVVDERYRVFGTITETELWESLPSHGLYARIGKLL